MKVYVASSWRNQHQQALVAALRSAGHEVYDFKNPRPGDNGFHWSEIDPAWKEWTPGAFRTGLEHPIARAGFASDMDALRACDACVLVLPCGRSAHLELGWASGAGKRTAVLMLEPNEPELMYRMLDGVCTSIDEVVTFLTAPLRASRSSQSGREAGFRERDGIDGVRVLSFEIEGIEPPARVYAHGAYDSTRRMVVAFSPPGEHYPVMFLYVAGFEEALALAREIGVAHKAGNVDAYIGRHKRECEAAETRSRIRSPSSSTTGGGTAGNEGGK